MSRAPTDPLAGTSCELTNQWKARTDQSPYEDLRALMRALDEDPPAIEIAATAWRYIPGLGRSDTHIVERIYDEFAEEHALARAERWLADRDEPPTITIPDAQTRQEDDGSVVMSDTVRATVESRLGARSARSCLDHDPNSVIGCAGPDGAGYCCPTCSQQRHREDAIIETLVVWVEIADTSQTIALRQDDRSDHYQSAQRVGNGHPEQTTCGRVDAIALLGKIVHSDSYLGAKCGPVEDMWPYPAEEDIGGGGQ